MLFLGLNSNKFYDNNVSSKGTVIFCSIELSDIWKLTPYVMYNIEIHKVLKNGPRIEPIPSFERRDHVESKYIIENDFDFFKIS